MHTKLDLNFVEIETIEYSMLIINQNGFEVYRKYN